LAELQLWLNHPTNKLQPAAAASSQQVIQMTVNQFKFWRQPNTNTKVGVKSQPSQTTVATHNLH
jgi:hypothetical protein